MELPFAAITPSIGSMFVIKISDKPMYGTIVGVTNFTITIKNKIGQIIKFERDSYIWKDAYIIMSVDEFEELLTEGEDITNEED